MFRKIFKTLDIYIVLMMMLITGQMIWWLIFFFNYQELYKNLLIKNDSLILSYLNEKHIVFDEEAFYFDEATKQYQIKKEVLEQRNEFLNKNKRMLIFEGSFFLLVFFIISILILMYYHKQRRLLEEKNIFLNSFTHELKTPITAIKLNLQTLQKKIKDNLLKQLISNSLYEINLLNQKLSRILYNKEIHISNFNKPNDIKILDLIQNIINELEGEIAKKNVKIQINHHLEINPLRLNIPSQWLLFVLKELILNSLKYSNDDVTIDINIDKINRYLKKYIKITISDNGWGLPQNINFKKLFEPYTRYHNENGYIEGTGLGLYYIEKIIKKSKGKIKIKNQEKGLTIELYLQSYEKT